MSTNALKYTSHEGVTKIVPLGTVRLVRPMTDEDKERAKESLKEKRGIDIDAARVNIRIEFGDKSSKLAQETLDALREQGVALVNLGSERYAPATNITGVEAFSREDADRLKGEDYTLKQTFRSKVETRAGSLSSPPLRFRSWIVVPKPWKPYRPTATTRSRWLSLRDGCAAP